MSFFLEKSFFVKKRGKRDLTGVDELLCLFRLYNMSLFREIFFCKKKEGKETLQESMSFFVSFAFIICLFLERLFFCKKRGKRDLTGVDELLCLFRLYNMPLFTPILGLF